MLEIKPTEVKKKKKKKKKEQKINGKKKKKKKEKKKEEKKKEEKKRNKSIDNRLLVFIEKKGHYIKNVKDTKTYPMCLLFVLLKMLINF